MKKIIILIVMLVTGMALADVILFQWEHDDVRITVESIDSNEPNLPPEPNEPNEPPEPPEPNEPNEPEPLRIIYVDGSLSANCIGTYSVDNRDDSGIETAYVNPQGAANNSQAGDLIYIREGTYYTSNTQQHVPVLRILTSGDANNPITYRNYNGETAIIDAYNPSNGVRKYRAVEIGNYFTFQTDAGKHYITIDGLIVQGGSYHGLLVYGPANSGPEDVDEPTTNITIKNCIARNNTGTLGYGIATQGTVIDCVIEYCETYNNKITGIIFCDMGKTWHGNEPEDLMSAARNSIIRNCLSYNNTNPAQPGNSDGIGISHGYQCSIENCISFNNGDDGIDIYASIECEARDNISMLQQTSGGNNCGFKFSAGGGGRHLIQKNVSVNNWGFGFEGSNPSGVYVPYYPSTLVNNTEYNCGFGFCAGSNYNTSIIPKMYVRNNILSDNSNHDIFGYSGLIDSDYNFISSASDLSAMQALGQDNNSVSGVAGFVDEDVIIDMNLFGTLQEKLDFLRNQVESAFSLDTNSPCIGTGEGGVNIGAY